MVVNFAGGFDYVIDIVTKNSEFDFFYLNHKCSGFNIASTKHGKWLTQTRIF